MTINFDISGWREDYNYQKYDTVFFTGDYKNSTTGCLQVQTGYYYAADSQAGAAGAYSASVASQSPTGNNTKWTRSFPSTPSYGSSVNFEAHNNRVNLGDGYYRMAPKSHNNIDVRYNLNFGSRTDRETKAILHFLGHRFETPYSGAQRTDDGIQTLTGFNFTPFSPYDQTGLYHCENFAHDHVFPNVNNINADFINDTNSATDWKNRIINLDNTSGFWAAGITYSKFDIVYYSGHDISNLSGYYYYSGDSSTTSDVANKPSVGATLWTKDRFFFKPTDANIPQQPRLLKTAFSNNEYTERASDGLNSNLLKLDLTFEGRDHKEAKALTHFLINKQGYQSFGFTPPNPYKQQYKFFVCEKWSENVVFNENKSISATFEEYPLNLAPPTTIFKTYLFDTGSSDKGEGARVIGNAAEGFHPPDGREVYQVNFGAFMTGFSSGTGFYLVNSGNQRIISDLYLSGENGTTGLYKFKDQGLGNQSFSIKDSPATHAQYTLDPHESGFFEVEFALTGKSGLIGENISLGLHKGITFYERGHTSYAGPHHKDSQLYIATVDKFGAVDPSGVLKIDLTGNASPVAPGPLADFRAFRTSGSCTITGSFEFTEPFTATGVTIEVSGRAHDTAHASDPATGVLGDFNAFSGLFGYHRNYYLDPLKNHNVALSVSPSWIGNEYSVQTSTEKMGGAFDFYGKPGKTYYFRARAQNIDIIGGNLNGGTSRTVLSTDYVHTSVTIPEQKLKVDLNERWASKVAMEWGEGAKSIGAQKTFGVCLLENANLRGFISGTLSGLKEFENLDGRLGDNSDLDIDDFVGISCHVDDNTSIFSADHTVPALITGPAATFSNGNVVPLTLTVSSSSNILGAGGKGGDASARPIQGRGGNACAASFSIAPGQPGMDRSRCKLGSVIELQGIGPISLYATSGLIDGKYFLPLGGDYWATNNSPQNGQDGGTAFHIDTSYNGETITINNFGFIGGGGGGGGAGGARLSNITALNVRQTKRIVVDADGNQENKLQEGYTLRNAAMQKGTASPAFDVSDITMSNLHMLQHRGLPKLAENDTFDGQHKNMREIRPGGGGGGGCGFDYQTNILPLVDYNSPGVGTTSPSQMPTLKSDGEGGMGIVGVGSTFSYKTADLIDKTLGGRGAKPRAFSKNAKPSPGGSTLYKVLNPSQGGGACQFSPRVPWYKSHAGAGGGGAWGFVLGVASSAKRGTYVVGDPSGMNVIFPDLDESLYNGGGFGGDGGWWGRDGFNGEHPVQNYIDRYISAEYGPEPRNFSYAGTGGLCIETNGAKLKFDRTGVLPRTPIGPMYEEHVSAIPNSGQDNKTREDSKNSELYRNVFGVGGYITCKHSNFATRAAGETLPIGLISGLQGRRLKATDAGGYGLDLSYPRGDPQNPPAKHALEVNEVASERLYDIVGSKNRQFDILSGIAGPSFEDCDRKKANSSNAVSQNASGSGMLPWKAFNQTIDGNFDDYVFFDSGVGGQVGFPYYLIYDLGEGNEAAIGSFSLSSAGASLSYYQNGDNHLKLFGECYAPTEFELRATNLPPGTAGVAESIGDSTVATHMLDENTDIIWRHPQFIEDEALDGRNRRYVAKEREVLRTDISEQKPYWRWQYTPANASYAGSNQRPLVQVGVQNSSFEAEKVASVLYDPDGGGADQKLDARLFSDVVKNYNGHRFNDYVCVPGATRYFTMYPEYKLIDVKITEDPNDQPGTIVGEQVHNTERRKKYRYYILKIFSADNFPLERLSSTADVDYGENRGDLAVIRARSGGKCKIADFGLRGYNKNYAGFIGTRS